MAEGNFAAWKAASKKIWGEGRKGMIGIPPMKYPNTPEELEKFQESYNKALANKVENLYKKAKEKK